MAGNSTKYIYSLRVDTLNYREWTITLVKLKMSVARMPFALSEHSMRVIYTLNECIAHK